MGTVLTFVVFLVIMAVVLYAVGAMSWAFLRTARTRIWLKDTVLVERRIVLSQRIDLRTARVELRSTAHAEGAELSLVATDERSGRGLDLLVQRGQTTLPAPELTALAQAIVSEHGPARPIGDDRAQATMVADALRELAANETRGGTRP